MADDKKITRRGLLGGNWLKGKGKKADQSEEREAIPEHAETPETDPETAEGISEYRDRISGLLSRRAVMGILGAAAVAGIASSTPLPALAGHRYERRDSPTPHSAEFLERMKEEELMRPKEVEKMRNCQEVIYRHYLNPSFQLHLSRFVANEKNPQGIRSNKVLKMLEIVTQYPHDLAYNETGNGYRTATEITKRPTSNNANVPDNLSIVIEGGYITQVNGMDLFDRSKDVPWKQPEDFHSQIYRATMQLTNYQGSTPLKDMPRQLGDIFNQIVIELPFRVVDLIRKRNASVKRLDPDLSEDSGWEKLLELLHEEHPHTLEEMEKLPPRVRIAVSRDTPGIYFLMDTRSGKDLLILSYEGYIMREKTDNEGNLTGEYEFDDAYEYVPGRGAGRLKSRYYDEHPKARNLENLEDLEPENMR